MAILGNSAKKSTERREEFIETLAVLFRRDDRGFFVAHILNFQEAFWFRRSIVNHLPELERNHRILRAMNHKKGNAGVLEPSGSVELSVNKELDAGKKPERFSRHSRG